jgi:hypothetical protein
MYADVMCAAWDLNLLPVDLFRCCIVLCCLLLQVKQSGMGHTATMVFKQSMNYLEPLYERLRKGQLVEELKVGGAWCGMVCAVLLCCRSPVDRWWVLLCGWWRVVWVLLAACARCWCDGAAAGEATSSPTGL